MTHAPDRIEASEFPPESVERIMQMLQSQIERPRLVGGDQSIELPQPLYELLIEVLTSVRQGRSILLVPENEEVTTQQAADILGVSRPHVVKLLQENNLLYRRVGTHRRIRLSDLRAYQKRRDQERTTVLNQLFDGIDADGAYE